MLSVAIHQGHVNLLARFIGESFTPPRLASPRDHCRPQHLSSELKSVVGDTPVDDFGDSLFCPLKGGGVVFNVSGLCFVSDADPESGASAFESGEYIKDDSGGVGSVVEPAAVVGLADPSGEVLGEPVAFPVGVEVDGGAVVRLDDSDGSSSAHGVLLCWCFLLTDFRLPKMKSHVNYFPQILSVTIGTKKTC